MQGKHSGNTLFSGAACLCVSVGLNAKSMSRLAQIMLLILISLALVPNQSISIPTLTDDNDYLASFPSQGD